MPRTAANVPVKPSQLSSADRCVASRSLRKTSRASLASDDVKVIQARYPLRPRRTWRRRRPLTGGHMAVAPVPLRGPAPPTNSACRYLRILLVENAEVSAPELVVVHGTQLDPGRVALGEAADVVDLELRARHVGRETAARVGQHERLGEVVVRAVDQRD